jgi:dephospho-CoA kinase
MKVIGFCGLPGSGKSTAIEAIRDLGRVVTMGDVIRNEAEMRGVEPTGENLGKIAREIREEGGDTIVAEKCVEMIKEMDEGIIFIDGLRSMAEVETFRGEWEFPIVAVTCPEELRFKRLSERGRSDDPEKIGDLKKRDEREKNLGVNQVIEEADIIIKNDGTKQDLTQETRKQVRQLVQDE